MTVTKFGSYAILVAERANLPDDVLQAIPLESIKNSAVGAAPKNIWQQLSGAIGGAITSAVNFIKNAVIAVGEFIKHAAEVIANAALSLYSTAVSTVKKAVEEVKKVVDSFLKGMESILKGIMEKLIRPLINAYNNYRDGLKNAVLDIANKYKESGKLSVGMIEELNSAIEREFFYGVIALGIGIWTAITLLQGISLGAATFIGPLVGVAMTMVVSEVFHSDKTSGTKIGSVSLNKNSLLEEIEKILHEKNVENAMYSLIGALLSTAGFILSLPAVSEVAADASGTAPAMLSYGTGFLSLVFAFAASGMELISHTAALVVGSVSVALGIESVALGLLGTRNTEITGNVVLSLGGMGLSAISIAMFLALR